MRGLALSEDRSFLLRPRDPAPILVQPRMLGDDMKPTAQLRQLEQSLWLANIDALAATRQIGEADRFVEPWGDQMSRIDDQVAVVGS